MVQAADAVNAAVARNLRIDCVKGGLMLLVILGHLLELFAAQSPWYKAICSAIYVFHMPLFVIIAGMFSRVSLENRDYRSIVSRLLVPLALFQILYLGLIAFKSGRLATLPLQPHWILWFLLSMALWRLALPLVARLRHALPLTVLLALMAGCNPEIGYAFSLSRTLYFYPFFLFGYQCRYAILSRMSTYRLPMAFSLVLIMSGIIWWSFHGLQHEALYGSRSYDAAPVLASMPLVGRLLMMGISLLASLAALSLMSVHWRFLALLGQRSLAILVLHGFFVMALAKLHLTPNFVLLPILFLSAVAIAGLSSCCDPYLTRVYEKIADILYLERTR